MDDATQGAETWEEKYEGMEADEAKEEQSRLCKQLKKAEDDKKAFNKGSRAVTKDLKQRINFLVDHIEESG